MCFVPLLVAALFSSATALPAIRGSEPMNLFDGGDHNLAIDEEQLSDPIIGLMQAVKSSSDEHEQVPMDDQSEDGADQQVDLRATLMQVQLTSSSDKPDTDSMPESTSSSDKPDSDSMRTEPKAQSSNIAATSSIVNMLQDALTAASSLPTIDIVCIAGVLVVFGVLVGAWAFATYQRRRVITKEPAPLHKKQTMRTKLKSKPRWNMSSSSRPQSVLVSSGGQSTLLEDEEDLHDRRAPVDERREEPVAVAVTKEETAHNDSAADINATESQSRDDLKRPGATLVVKIIQARDIAAKDDSGTSDPYCEIVMGNEIRKTAVMLKTLNPRWDHTFRFEWTPGDLPSLKLTMWDDDENDGTGAANSVKNAPVNPDQSGGAWEPPDFLGKVDIRAPELRKLLESSRRDMVRLGLTSLPVQDHWYKLHKRSMRSHVSGQVRIQLYWENL